MGEIISPIPPYRFFYFIKKEGLAKFPANLKLIYDNHIICYYKGCKTCTPYFLEYVMKNVLICFVFLFVGFIALCFADMQACAADTDTDVDYTERYSQLKEQIIKGDYGDVLAALKQIVLNDDLSHAEKYDLLEKNYYIFKDLGKYSEAGEVLELNYLISDPDEKVLAKVHDELITFYRTVRKWSKCIETHFYYIEHARPKPEKMRAVLFAIVADYQKNRDYAKANQVLEEVLSLCESKEDFAYLYYYQAQGSFNQNNYDNAVELYKKALEQEALTKYDKAVALYNLGFCYEIRHKTKDALAAYEQALPIAQNSLVIENRINKLRGKK